MPSESTNLPREEIEARMERRIVELRREFQQSQAHQDEEWNKGFRAIREDIAVSESSVKDYIKSQIEAFEKLFLARLSPIQLVSYGMVGMLAVILTGLLSSLMRAR